MWVKAEARRLSERLQQLQTEMQDIQSELVNLDEEEGELLIALGQVDPTFQSFCPPLTPEDTEAYRDLYATLVEG